MRAGKVARIRVNPKDCMSTVDLCKLVGLNPGSMNFSQSVSAAYSTLLEMCRKQGTIPRRDGFEYLQLMGSLKETVTTSDRAERAIEAPRSPEQGQEVVDRDRMDRRWNELVMRKQFTPENMTIEEERELEALHKELGYPAVKAGG